MSFGDMQSYPAGNRNMGETMGVDALAPIKVKLAQFQKSCSTTKEMITDMRRRQKVAQPEKARLDQQIKDLKKADSDLRTMFDQKQRGIDAADSMTKATFSKLQKDYEKARVNVDALAKESLLVRVDAAGGASGPSASFGASVGRALDGDGGFSGGSGGMGPSDNGNGPLLLQQSMARPVMQEHDIDEMLIEERRRDIEKINKDLVIVQDLFVRMADIVGEQGEKVEEIHKATEVSHERAEAGLEQVKQAATYQPTCVIS